MGLLALLPLAVAYFFVSGGITIYNKWLITDVGFDCPVLLIVMTYSLNFGIAASLRAIGGRRGWRFGGVPLKQVLPTQRWVTMIPIGICAGLEVAASNLSLLTLDVAFHTMVKAATPIFVLFFSVVLGIQPLKLSLVGVVILVSGGVAVLSAGEREGGGGAFSAWGFCFTVISCALSGLRWALSQVFLQGKRGSRGHGRGKVNPLTLLYYMSPFSVIALVPVSLASEWGKADVLFSGLTAATALRLALLVGTCAVLAFCLVMVEFRIVQQASSLTLCMIGVIKELLLVLTAVVLLGNSLPGICVLGFFLTLGGVVGYHAVAHWAPAPPADASIAAAPTSAAAGGGSSRGEAVIAADIGSSSGSGLGTEMAPSERHHSGSTRAGDRYVVGAGAGERFATGDGVPLREEEGGVHGFVAARKGYQRIPDNRRSPLAGETAAAAAAAEPPAASASQTREP